MANVITDPIFYAQEGVIALEKALGLAGRVYRGYDKERRSYGKGSTIHIDRPGTFEAQDAPSSSQDIKDETVEIRLENWKEVKFSLTDKELAYTGEEIIQNKIKPAAYALADAIDQGLANLYKYSGHVIDRTSTSASIDDILVPRKTAFDNKMPLDDNVHYMIDGNLEQAFLGLSQFTSFNGSGNAGVDAQMRGSLGRRFGAEIFANQNTPTHTAGNLSDTAGTVDGAHTAGSTTLSISNLSASQDIKSGDTLTIAGNTYSYSVISDASTDGSGNVTVTLNRGLLEDVADGTVVNISQVSGVQNLFFHEYGIALATAPLSELGDGAGAKISTITDPITKLSLRARQWYDGNNSKLYVALDVLFGYSVLQPDLLVRNVR